MVVLFRYVGPDAIAVSRPTLAQRHGIESASDAEKFLDLSRASSIVATFVVDERGALWLADRHSEHVHCARGLDVQAAGEIEIARDDAKSRARVVAITNQSTGYCPEPDTSWAAIRDALDRAQIAHPDAFTARFEFRQCPRCAQINVIKDDDFSCACCNTTLPAEPGFSRRTR